MTERIYFKYLRDPHDYERVMTLAYQKQEDGVTKFAFAMNNPGHKDMLVNHDGSYRYLYRERSDRFNKALGRKIATARLEKPIKVTNEHHALNTLYVVVGSDQDPVEVFCKTLTDMAEHPVGFMTNTYIRGQALRIAREYLEACEFYREYKEITTKAKEELWKMIDENMSAASAV